MDLGNLKTVALVTGCVIIQDIGNFLRKAVAVVGLSACGGTGLVIGGHITVVNQRIEFRTVDFCCFKPGDGAVVTSSCVGGQD